MRYVPGSHLVVADALSRAYLPIEAADQPDEFEINLLSYGHVSETMLKKLTPETGKDPELQQLHKVVMSGWPWTKHQWKLGLIGTTGMRSAAMRG